MRRPYNFQCHDENHPVFSVLLSFVENDEILSGKIKIQCPICGSESKKTLKGCTITSYIRGNGIVLDKEGAKREANIWQLQNDDPYKKLRRQSKESVSDAIDKIKSEEKLSKLKSPNALMKFGGDAPDDSFQHCTACGRTLFESDFDNGTEHRCNDCTEKNNPPKYRLNYNANSKKYEIKWSK